MSNTGDDDFMLEDEDENSGHLQPPYSSLSSAMVSSPTTDTLDSVALEPSAFDDFGKESINKPQDGSSNISSYFANSSDDVFDSLTAKGAQSEETQLGNDLFMSIAISKSDEDIRVSEMNAIEIKDSDVIGTVLSPEEEGMKRINSFMLKREQEKELEDILQEETENSQKGTGPKGTLLVENSIEGMENKGLGDQSDEENVTHVRREHKSSTCEPETIAFEGEGETGTTDQTDLQIADLAEEEIEEFTQNDETPGFLSQVSRSSEHSDSPQAGIPAQISQQPPLQQAPSVLSPPIDAAARLQGPTVGTTPSQMSPMGTPVHQASEPQDTAGNPPGLETQTSVPSSPFHQAVQETKKESVFAPFGSSDPSDDAFTSILSMSDADRRYDAWIPSDATSHILKTMAVSPAGTFVPATEQLSTPVVLTNESQGDPVRDLVLRYMGEQEAIKRSCLTADNVTQDIDGLKKLIEAGCLRAAIDLTGKLLEQVGQGYGKVAQATVHTPHSLQLWFCRLALMVKLRMYEQAEAEMRAFQTLDTPDLYFQFYANTYPGRRGSMVSFSMRLLHAELPLLCGRSQESLDRLYYMLAVCNRIKTNLASDLSEDGSATHMTYEARKVSQELWNRRELDIIYKIGSTMLAVKDYEGALAIYNSLLEKDKNAHQELMAGIGRIHLQMGNITEASRILKEVEAESSKTSSSISCHNLINRGLVAMCGANFYDAYQHFKSAVQMQPHNTCAVNNMAVCSLYLGRLKDALNTLEQLVHSDPANTLHEGVLFNLCTLYELETSRALHKKQAILDLVSKHKGDGFPVACLKMT